MNTKSSLLAAISYGTVLAFLLCFLTLLTIVGIAVSPASAQSVLVFAETPSTRVTLNSALSTPDPSLRIRLNAASAILNKHSSRASARPTSDSATVWAYDVDVPIRTAPLHTAPDTVPVRTSPVQTAMILNFRSSFPESFWQALLLELGRPELSGSLAAQQQIRHSGQLEEPLFEGPLLWLRSDRLPLDTDFPEIVQIRLLGDCYSRGESPNPPRVGPLGWTYLVSSTIQPFVVVDCDRVRDTLATNLRNQPREIQQQALARAISRVIFHELTHILTQSADHAPSGIQKAYLTPADLTQPSIP